jgi:Zn-dependent alcohol dehydrogenase
MNVVHLSCAQCVNVSVSLEHSQERQWQVTNDKVVCHDTQLMVHISQFQDAFALEKWRGVCIVIGLAHTTQSFSLQNFKLMQMR